MGELRRARIFSKNMAIAKKDNEEAGGEAIFGATKFSDLTPAEFKSQYLTYRRSDRQFRGSPFAEVLQPSAPASDSVDWRTKQEGVVSAVKNQGNCGSCWAYSATEEIESMWVLAGNKPIKLSPQQIISCDKNDLGCNGGDTITAYKYVMKAGGMASEKEYKDTSERTGKNGRCKKFEVAGGDISGHTFATRECSKGKSTTKMRTRWPPTSNRRAPPPSASTPKSGKIQKRGDDRQALRQTHGQRTRPLRASGGLLRVHQWRADRLLDRAKQLAN